MCSIIYCRQICLLFLDHPVLSIRKEKTNLLIMCNIYNEETAFYSYSFLLADKKGVLFCFFFSLRNIHRVPCLRKEKNQMVQSCSCIFKKDQGKQFEKFDCPVHQIKRCQKKSKILLECVVSTSTVKNTLKGVLVAKGKLKSDPNTISDIIRDEDM